MTKLIGGANRGGGLLAAPSLLLVLPMLGRAPQGFEVQVRRKSADSLLLS